MILFSFFLNACIDIGSRNRHLSNKRMHIFHDSPSFNSCFISFVKLNDIIIYLFLN